MQQNLFSYYLWLCPVRGCVVSGEDRRGGGTLQSQKEEVCGMEEKRRKWWVGTQPISIFADLFIL